MQAFRPFLTRLFLFASATGLYWASCFALNAYLLARANLPFDGVRTLLLGDSHIACNLSPQAFGQAANVAQFGEPFAASYWKLKYLNERLPLDTVVFGLSPHNLSSFHDTKFRDGDFKHLLFTRYYAIGEFEGASGLAFDRKLLYSTRFERFCLRPYRNHSNFLGAYQPRQDTSATPEIIGNSLRKHYGRQDEPFGFSAVETAYLDSIAAFCRRQNVHLVVVSTPLHPDYYRQIPENFVQKHRQELARLAEKPGITVIDETTRFYPEEQYVDGDHLNEAGAQRFSVRLARLMRERDGPPD